MWNNNCINNTIYTLGLEILFETQPIEDLLHFKAAPAGFSYIILYYFTLNECMIIIFRIFVLLCKDSDRAAVISIQGQRKYMEDTYQAIPNLSGHNNWSYYGVYDGHGGARCSVYVAHYLHKHVLAWVDAYISHYSTNSQRLINLLINEKQIFNQTISCNQLLLSSTSTSSSSSMEENSIDNDIIDEDDNDQEGEENNDKELNNDKITKKKGEKEQEEEEEEESQQKKKANEKIKRKGIQMYFAYYE